MKRVQIAIFFCLIFFLADGVNNKHKFRQQQIDIIKTDNLKTLKQKQINPKNVRTKTNMMKSVIGLVLDQLEVPDTKSEKVLSEATPQSLVVCMNVLKDIARGHKQLKDLVLLENALPGLKIQDNLLDNTKLVRAKKVIDRFISPKDLI